MKYTKGFTFLENEPSVDKNKYTLKPATKSDEMIVKSLLTLPLLEFSHINLPNSNILDKAHLNLNHIHLWKILNENSFVNSNVIESLDNNTNYNSLFEDLNEHVLDENLYDNTDVDMFKKYLSSIIPDTNTLIDNIDKDALHSISIKHYTNTLEPFNIYVDDLHIDNHGALNILIDK